MTDAAPPAYKTLEDAIGGTPLVQLQRLPGAAGAARGNVILGKLEGNNPAGSVKDRPAIAMIRGAEERGEIRPGDTLIEATSGNTGIALAMAAAIRGYRMVLVMPEDLSIERAQTMRAFGAELVLTPKSGGMEYARDLAEQMQRDGRGRVLDQFANADNPHAHYAGTGPEIWSDTGGRVTHFVSAMGTTGTITGVSRYLKRTQGRPVLSVAVEPAASPVLTQTRNGEPLKPGPHKIQGLGAGFVPAVLDLSLVDAIEQVGNDEAVHFARRLAREEGILSGISCGAATAAAVRWAHKPESAGKTIVVVLPDSGERYLSSVLFEDLFDAAGLPLAAPSAPSP